MSTEVTPQIALGLLAGLAVGGGLALFIAALVGWVRPERGSDEKSLADRLQSFVRGRGGLGLLVGLVVLAASRWPVAAIAAGLLVWFGPKLFGGAAAERASMARVEALAGWTESLRDIIAGAVSLEQAIPATARAAAPALRPQLTALSDRLRARIPLADALRMLGDDLADPDADLVVAALILNSRVRGPGLRDVLTDLAGAAREQVDMRRRIFSSRAGTRRSVQIVVGVVLSFIGGMMLLNHDYVSTFGSLIGQIVLAVVFGLFGASFLWMRKLSTPVVGERLLSAVGDVQ